MTTTSSGARIETDTFGPIEVAADRYWGAQTQRSLENFKIGTEPAARPAAAHQPPAASDVAALPTPANPPTPAETPDPAPGGGEVVRLDRFRKK